MTCGEDIPRLAKKETNLGSMVKVRCTLIDEKKIPEFSRSKSFLFKEHKKTTLDNLYTFEADRAANNLMQKFRGIGISDHALKSGLGVSSRNLNAGLHKGVKREPSSQNIV